MWILSFKNWKINTLFSKSKAVEDTRYTLMKRRTSSLLFPKMNDFPQISIYEVQRSLYNRKLRFLAQWGDIISKVPCIISCPLIFIRFFFSIWQVWSIYRLINRYLLRLENYRINDKNKNAPSKNISPLCCSCSCCNILSFKGKSIEKVHSLYSISDFLV